MVKIFFFFSSAEFDEFIKQGQNYGGPEGTSLHKFFITLHKFWLVWKKYYVIMYT